MDFFEEAEKDLTEKKEQSALSEDIDPMKLPEGAVRIGETDDDFWKGIKKVNEPKRKGR